MLILLLACGAPSVQPAAPTPAIDASPPAPAPPADDTDDVLDDTGVTEDTGVVDDTDVTDDTDVPPTPPPSDTGSPPASGTCNLGPHARSFTLQVPFNGINRTALVNLPAGYDGTTDLPVVLSFHGLVMNAASQRSYTGMAGAANSRGWIAVHPEAFPEWNVLPGSPDVDFVHAMLDALESTVCVDTSRVYSTGMSQGGHVSYMLGCTMSDRIAAIAPVAGSDFNVMCNPPNSVPVLHIHGTSDLIVSYYGGILYDSAPNVVRDWSQDINGCNQPPQVTLQQGNVTCETRSCSTTDEATLCTVDGGGHTWPGAAPMFWLGNTSQAIDANLVILDFFEQYSR